MILAVIFMASNIVKDRIWTTRCWTGIAALASWGGRRLKNGEKHILPRKAFRKSCI